MLEMSNDNVSVMIMGLVAEIEGGQDDCNLGC